MIGIYCPSGNGGTDKTFKFNFMEMSANVTPLESSSFLSTCNFLLKNYDEISNPSRFITPFTKDEIKCDPITY